MHEFSSYLPGFSSAEEADQHRKALMYPDNFGVFGIWDSNLNHSLWCIMPKAALEVIQDAK